MRTDDNLTTNGAIRNRRQSLSMRRFMAAASVSALVVAGPPIVIAPVHAQALPAGCSDATTVSPSNNNNGQFDNGETISCVSPSTIGEVETSVFDPTIVIGDAATPTNVASGSGESYGVLLSAGGSVYVNNAASTVSGFYNGINVSTQTYDPNDITIVSEGSISGGTGVGLRTGHSGYGDTVIDVVDVSGPVGGIRAENLRVFGGDISITSTGAITSTGGTGIRAANAGAAGSTYINVADVSGGGFMGYGIHATNDGVDLTIISSGSINGFSGGVTANNNGSGATAISVNDITTTVGDGISVEHRGAGLAISATGTISGDRGVDVNHRGDGDAILNLSDVNSRFDGVGFTLDSAYNADISVGAVYAGSTGVDLTTTNASTGNLSFTASGEITSTASGGVRADLNGGGAASITVQGVTAAGNGVNLNQQNGDVTLISYGTIDAGADGVVVGNSGTGATTFSLRDITAVQDGILAVTTNTVVGDINITTTGDLTAGERGVALYNFGAGDATINVVNVTAGAGGSYDGVYVNHAGGDLSLTSTGTITASRSGVNVDFRGTGDAVISLYDVDAGWSAVALDSDASTTGDITVTASGMLTSGRRGIDIAQGGVGALTVSVNGVDAGQTGALITTSSSTTGDVTFASSGLINTNSQGVRLLNDGSGNVDISLTDVTSRFVGVYARNEGGDLSVTATGAIASSSDDGVHLVNNGAGATYLSVVDVSGGASADDGIIIQSAGTDLTLIATGAVYGSNKGVDVSHTGTGAASLSLNSINAGTEGLDFDFNSAADAAISVDTVTAGFDGVRLNGAASSMGEISFTATGDVTSQRTGIFVDQNGSGAVTLNVDNVYAGTSSPTFRAIRATNNGGDLTIVSTGTLSAGGNAVEAIFDGRGDGDFTLNNIVAGGRGLDLRVTSGSNASVEVDTITADGVGAFLTSSSGAGDVSFTATGDITSQSLGVQVDTRGSGLTSLNLTNVYAGTGASHHGLSIIHEDSAIDVNASGRISAGGNGVTLSQRGFGSANLTFNEIDAGVDGLSFSTSQAPDHDPVAITVTGALTADRHGVALSLRGTSDLTLSLADVTAGTGSGHHGIYGSSEWRTYLDLTSTGTITAGGDGVNLAISGVYDKSISLNTINAGGRGVYIDHRGAALDLSVSGTITAVGTGVDFRQEESTGDATIALGDVASQYRALDLTLDSNAYNTTVTTGALSAVTDVGVNIQTTADSTGDIDFTATGDINTASQSGVYANTAGGGALSISVAGVTAAGTSINSKGIFVNSHHGGDLNIEAGGAITSGRYGVIVDNQGSGTANISLTAIYSADDALRLDHYGTDLNVAVAGAITSGGNGVFLRHYGDGDAAIALGDVSSSGTAFILDVDSAYDSAVTTGALTSSVTGTGAVLRTTAASTGDIDFTAIGAINAAGPNGVYVETRGSGALSISVADVTATGISADGIYVEEHRGGDLAIQSSGVITAADRGIRVSNFGTGTTDVSVSAVYSVDNALTLLNSGSTNGLFITATGPLVSQTGDGVVALNQNGGDTIVNLTDVTAASAGSQGVRILTSSSGANLVINATGTITGDRDGIEARNSGSGSTTINLNNIVSYGVNSNALDLLHRGTDLSVDIAGVITSGGAGVRVTHSGAGAAILNLNDINADAGGVHFTLDSAYSADISTRAVSAGGIGVNLTTTNTSSGNLSFTAADEITSTSSDGLLAALNGTGDTTITVADVTTNRDGLNIDQQDGNLTLYSIGAIGVGEYGVIAINAGTGATTISLQDVTAGRGGIFAYAASTVAGNVNVTTTGGITSARRGLELYNYGSGDTTVSIGNVTAGTGGAYEGVLVRHDGGDLSFTSTGRIAASQYGVDIDFQGTGDATISLNEVDAVQKAVSVVAAATATGDVSVTASGAIVSGADAIDIDNDGAGAVSVSVADVTAGSGSGDTGIDVRSAGGDLTVSSTGTVTAGNKGVYVYNRGTGATTVNVNNIDTEGGAVGAFTLGSGASSDLSVMASGHIESGEYGVLAANLGSSGLSASVNSIDAVDQAMLLYVASGATGDLELTATGAIASQQFKAVGVYQYGSGDTMINVAGVSVTGEYDAINIDHRGGDLSLTATGSIASGGYGVRANNSGTGNTTISVGSVAADYGAGIFAQNENAGALSITATGAISALSVDNDYSGVGVWADAQAGGGVAVSVADVYGQRYGVSVQSTGGAVNVTAESVGAYYYDAVRVFQSSGAGDVSITTTGAVTSEEGNGVYVENLGTGATAISVNSVTASDGIGIAAISVRDGGALSISATGDVQAFGDDNSPAIASDVYGFYSAPTGVGILAIAQGGGVAVSAADVHGEIDGIQVSNRFSGDASVSATNVSGGARDGVSISNGAETDTSLTITESVSGYRFGINARSYSDDGSITITVHDVSGVFDDGIRVIKNEYSDQSGDVVVTTTGDVSGGVHGIDADVVGLGSLEIASYNVSGVADGVNAYAYSGAVSITTTGTVTATNGDGVRADHNGLGDAVAADVSISVATVTGGARGIYATNGNGAVNITVAGAVTGEGGEGILSVASAGAEITINDGGSVTGAGAALRIEGDADDVLTLNAGGAISGNAFLLGGDDVFNDASGQYTTVFGGDGTDTVNFLGGGRTITGSGADGDALQGVEVLNFNAGGYTLAGAHAGLSAANFNAGENTLTGVLTAEATTVAEGAILNKADGSVINGALTVNGTLSIGNSPGVSTVDGDVVFGSSSVLPIEIQGDEHDMLVVSGEVTLDGLLQIIYLGGLQIGETTRTIIDAGTALNGSHAAISSDIGTLISNSIDVDPSSFDLTLKTIVRSAETIEGLTDEEESIAKNLLDNLGEAVVDPEFAALIGAIGAIPDVEDLRSALGELRPEGFDGGLRFLANSQSRFVSRVMEGPGAVGGVWGSGDDGPHAWMSVDLSRLSQEADMTDVGVIGDVYEFSAGVSNIGRGTVRFGVASGYARLSGDTKAGLTDDVDASLFRLAGSAQVAMEGAGANGHAKTVLSFAHGENELDMTLVNPIDDTPLVQSGEADMTSFGVATRFTLSGVDGKAWPLRPYAEIGYDTVRQGAVRVGKDQPTALLVEKVKSGRAHVALGASYDRPIMERVSLEASLTGVRYFGDTENDIRSRFAAAPADAPSFQTLGANVEWLTRMRAGLAYEHKSGFRLTADGFGEAGDVSAYGARLELSKDF